MATSSGYSIADYGSMITDQIRMQAYYQAMQQSIKPGATVLDIGTGTGICSLLACQLGAERVYAIEPDGAIQVAQAIAVANGYGDRIEFLQALSTEVTLPGPVDVIVSDLRGTLPLYSHHIPTLIDARQRFLKPGGVLIPQQDRLWVTVVTAERIYRDFDIPWSDNPYGLNMEAGRSLVTNSWGNAREVTPEMFLVEPQVWATLDYLTITSPDVVSELQWSVARSGTAHGFCLWFEATPVTGIGYSTAPGQPNLVYGRAFMPLSHPVELEQGDSIILKLKADLVGSGYIWGWATKVFNRRSSENCSETIKANFNQSTFFSTPLSPKQLRKLSDQFIPELNASAKVDRFVLSLMEQGLSLGTIAQQLTEKFNDRFPTWKSALTYVGELSQRYSD